MKYACPKCGALSIRLIDKFKAHGLAPVACDNCGSLLKPGEDSQFANAISPFIGMFVLPAFGIWSLLIKSWLPLIFCFLAIIVWLAISFHQKPMVEVNLQKEIRGHWIAFFVLFFIFMGLVLHGIYNH